MMSEILPPWLVVVISVIALALTLYGMKYVLQARAERRMQEQVRSILFEYMPANGVEMEAYTNDVRKTLSESLI